jgi:hypothetical protein
MAGARAAAALFLFVFSSFDLALGSTGDGRFNKAYCFHGNAWGNVSFWESVIATPGLYRVAQLTAVNESGTYYLTVVPPSLPSSSSPADASAGTGTVLGALAFTATPTNVTVDLGCNNRSMPDYSAISFGTASSAGGGPVVWASGPIGDHTAGKTPRCWWVRCDVNETEADTCGSEGEAPCTKLDATFTRYVSPPPPGGSGTAPVVDSACYPIAVDSQVDPTHRVDFRVRFVDGLWPPGG